ncbi:hypothetical protein [Paracoccus sp. JM45]|uniref:hypothetical protein n=1 Tax=Paracoccus sp. JM45 TaxID=2283626 RepID=UPI0015FFDC2E|nr:hypothetical protein [Paracoccus sp. JM45]
MAIFLRRNSKSTAFVAVHKTEDTGPPYLDAVFQQIYFASGHDRSVSSLLKGATLCQKIHSSLSCPQGHCPECDGLRQRRPDTDRRIVF